MREFITIFLLAWLPGFLLTLLVNVGGPPTIGLALLRATVWNRRPTSEWAHVGKRNKPQHPNGMQTND